MKKNILKSVALATLLVAANIAYGMINDPYTMIFGRTIGGREVTSNERVGAFANSVPSLITGGLVKTGQVIKTAGGLKGYNEFLKSTNKAGIHYSGTGWQKQAGKMYKMNKIANGSVDDLKHSTRTYELFLETNNELNK